MITNHAALGINNTHEPLSDHEVLTASRKKIWEVFQNLVKMNFVIESGIYTLTNDIIMK